MMSAMIYLDLLLALGLTLRLARVITVDDIGLWYVRGPLSEWAMDHEPPLPEGLPEGFGQEEVWVPVGWRARLAVGLSCPFCVGFWVAGAVLLSLWALGGPGQVWEPWRWVAGWFTLNWVAAHVGSRLGDS